MISLGALEKLINARHEVRISSKAAFCNPAFVIFTCQTHIEKGYMIKSTRPF
jgi:hypothetical protein